MTDFPHLILFNLWGKKIFVKIKKLNSEPLVQISENCFEIFWEIRKI